MYQRLLLLAMVASGAARTARIQPASIPSYDNELGLNSPTSYPRHHLSSGLHRHGFRLLFHKSRRSWHAPVQITPSTGQAPRAHSRCAYPATASVERTTLVFQRDADVAPRICQVMVCAPTLPSLQTLHGSCRARRSVSRHI